MKKKLPFAALTMAGILGASVWLQPLTAYAAAWERSGNVYEMPDGPRSQAYSEEELTYLTGSRMWTGTR